jgi:hypothetical protein
MSKNEYIIHGTQPINLLHILKDGFIDNEPIKKYRTMLKTSPKLIFTQLIYPDIPNEKRGLQPLVLPCYNIIFLISK